MARRLDCSIFAAACAVAWWLPVAQAETWAPPHMASQQALMAALQDSSARHAWTPLYRQELPWQRHLKTATTTSGDRQLNNYYYNYKNNDNNDQADNSAADTSSSASAIDWSSLGFDITQYSAQYIGCSAVQTYSDTVAAQQTGTVLAARRFAVLRLCPYFSCNPYKTPGCDKDYGEYAVDLDNYLASISVYTAQMMEAKCEYCSYCDQNNQTDYSGNACNAKICKNYSDDCDETASSFNNTAALASSYFTCTAVQVDDEYYYLGPHCASDGYTVSIGVYSEATCTNYIGDKTPVYSVLGFTIKQNSMDFLPVKCLACKESTSYPWLKSNSDSDVSEICAIMYQDSAKCNVNLNDAASTYTSDQQKSNEALACNYIANLVNHTYNEAGFIVLDHQYTFNASNWKSETEYIRAAHHARTAVDPWYIVALTFVLLACAILVVWACCLHRALAKRNVPWRPRRGKNTDPTAISRQNSGIVMGRSRSGMSGKIPLI